MERYFSKSIIIICFFMGACAYIVMSFFIQWQSAAMYSLIFVLGLMTALPFFMYISDSKYKDITINEEILLKENINFKTNNGVQNGFIYFTSEVIYIFGRDKKPYFEEKIFKDDFLNAELIGDIHLYIYKKDVTFLQITSANCYKILNVMIQNEWIDTVYI